MHVLTAPLLANTAHDKTSKGKLAACSAGRGKFWIDLSVISVSDQQEGSTKINPVCPGECRCSSFCSEFTCCLDMKSFSCVCRQLPDSSAVGSDPGAAHLLCGTPHLPHQDVHHEQRPAQESAGAHELKAHLPRSL